jgi:hypothetical protein
MTFTTFVDILAEHWVLISLVLCPIVVVMLALAALTCEACGAPFGIFRRRQRTIDLCLRCAVLHDVRRANDARKQGGESGSAGTPRNAKSGDAEPHERQEDSREERREERLFSTQSPVELGVAGHPSS